MEDEEWDDYTAEEVFSGLTAAGIRRGPKEALDTLDEIRMKQGDFERMIDDTFFPDAMFSVLNLADIPYLPPTGVLEIRYPGTEEGEESAWLESIAFEQAKQFDDNCAKTWEAARAKYHEQAALVPRAPNGVRPTPFARNIKDKDISNVAYNRVAMVSCVYMNDLPHLVLLGCDSYAADTVGADDAPMREVFADATILKVCTSDETEAILTTAFNALSTTTLDEVEDELCQALGVFETPMRQVETSFPCAKSVVEGIEQALKMLEMFSTYCNFDFQMRPPPVVTKQGESQGGKPTLWKEKVTPVSIPPSLEAPRLREIMCVAAWLARTEGLEEAQKFVKEHGIAPGTVLFASIPKWPVFRTQYFNHPRFAGVKFPDKMQYMVQPWSSEARHPVSIARSAFDQLAQAHADGRFVWVAIQKRCAKCPGPLGMDIEKPFCGLRPVLVGKLRQGRSTPTWKELLRRFAAKVRWCTYEMKIGDPWPDYCLGYATSDVYVYIIPDQEELCNFCNGKKPNKTDKFFSYVVRHSWEFREYAVTYERARYDDAFHPVDHVHFRHPPPEDPTNNPPRSELRFLSGSTIAKRLRRLWSPRVWGYGPVRPKTE
jgi:hypothetical protein